MLTMESMPLTCWNFYNDIDEMPFSYNFQFPNIDLSEYSPKNFSNDEFSTHGGAFDLDFLMDCNCPDHDLLYIEPLPNLEDDYEISYGVKEGFGDWSEIIDDAVSDSEKLYLCYNGEDSGNEIKKEVVDVKPEGVERISDSNTKNLSRKAISQYFYMPITQAARELNVGLTHLKKRCRELGIRRWPHRKLMSLQTLINNIQELGKEEGLLSEEKWMDIEKLEKEMRLVEEMPDIQLQDHTKRLRQHCFKANYKKRKLMDQLMF